MVTHAEATTPVMAPTGHLTPAPLPTTRQALIEGAIDEDHVEVIVATLKKLPAWVSVADQELAESTLADAARSATPDDLTSLGTTCWSGSIRTAPNPPTPPSRNRSTRSW
jgi:Domain of unknown function (DUF222)